VLLGGALALTQVDLGGLARPRLERQFQALGEVIGRQVQLGSVRLRLVPLRAELAGLTVAAAPGAQGPAAQPLAELRALRLQVALWPLVRSLGRELSITDLEIDGLTLRVARLPDGGLSIDDVAERLRARPRAQEQAARGLTLARLALRDAALRFHEGDATAALAPIQLTARDVGANRRVQLELEAAVQAAGRGLDQATVKGRAEVELPDAGPLRLAADGQVLGLTLVDVQPGQPPSRGQATDLRLRADLRFDRQAGAVRSQLIEVAAGPMRVSASADLRGLWTTPEVHALSLTSQGITLEGLLQLLPPSQRPRGAWRGPVALSAAASGPPGSPRLRGKLDLSEAALGRGALRKPAGAPLSAEFEGQLQPGALRIDRLGLVLGQTALFVHGLVRGREDVDLRIDSGEVPLQPLVTLLQAAKEGGPARLRASKERRPGGVAQIEGALRAQGAALSGHIKARLRGAQVALAAFGLSGEAALSLALRGGPEGVSLRGEADLTPARLFAAGVVDKAAGVPLRLDLDALRAGRRITLRRAEAHLPGGEIALAGEVDAGGRRMDLRLQPVDVDLTRLGQVVPVLRRVAGGLLAGRLRARAAVAGDLEQLAGARLRVEDLDLDLGGGHLRGGLEVAGLAEDAPRRLSFDLRGEGVDLDRLRGAAGGGAGGDRGDPAAGGGAGARLEGGGRLHLSSGRLAGTPLRDLVAEVSLRQGVLQLKTLRAAALGGTLGASGSSIELARSRFNVRAKVERVDLGALGGLRGPEEAPRSGAEVVGRASGEIALEGGGATWAEVAPTLQGEVALRVSEARVRNASLQATIIIPVLNRLRGPGNAGPPLGQGGLRGRGGEGQGPRETDLRELDLRGRVLTGRLHLTAPLRFQTAEVEGELSGSIGLDRSLDLTGEVRVAPEAFRAATKGRLAPRGPVPVGVHITGMFPRPQIELRDLSRALGALAGSALRGRLLGPPPQPQPQPPSQPQPQPQPPSQP
jgi:hypothetical protein